MAFRLNITYISCHTLDILEHMTYKLLYCTSINTYAYNTVYTFIYKSSVLMLLVLLNLNPIEYYIILTFGTEKEHWF